MTGPYTSEFKNIENIKLRMRNQRMVQMQNVNRKLDEVLRKSYSKIKIDGLDPESK